LSETFFPYFFHVHLNILDKVVSSLYAIFGTPCIQKKNTERLQFKPKKCTPAEELVQIMKQNAELRKSKILKKQADLDDSDMFYLSTSMSKAAKTLPKIAQASVRMKVCKLVSEAQIRHFQHRSQFASSTPNSPHTTSSSTSSCRFTFSPSLTSTQASNLSTSRQDEWSPEYTSGSLWR
jgi:hypothetical protein